MLDESLDGAGDVMLDGDEAPIFDTDGDAMELNAASHVDHSQEYSLDGIADEGEDFLDDDLFSEHFQDEVAYDEMEILNDNTSPSVQ